MSVYASLRSGDARSTPYCMAFLLGVVAPLLGGGDGTGVEPVSLEAVSTPIDTSTLEIEFCYPDGRPVAGVEVALLPPLLAGEPWGLGWEGVFRAPLPPIGSPAARSAVDSSSLPIDLGDGRSLDPRFRALGPIEGWVVRSSAAGRVRWKDVPSASGYRWGLLSSQLADMVPEHEDRQVRAVDAGALITHSRIRSLSGPFDLAADEVHVLHVTIHEPGALWGRLRAPASAAPFVSVIKVYECSDVSPAGGVELRREQLEAFVHGAADGSFHLAGIRPGEKALRAVARVGGEDYHFFHAAFHLAEGEMLHVGELEPMRGSSFSLVVSLVDSRGAPLEAAQALGGDPGADAILSLQALPDPSGEAPALIELFGVPLARVVRLHGLPAGTLRVAAHANPAWLPTRDGCAFVGNGEFHEFAGSPTGTVELEIGIDE